uniref:Peptidase S1 domain-containing protein n=1 Tax=Rhabditophanes sp. KR3021 TaxID=114890 RepID=A0AC35UAV5_9BILA
MFFWWLLFAFLLGLVNGYDSGSPFVHLEIQGTYSCSGTTFGTRYIITAAHCFYLSNKHCEDPNFGITHTNLHVDKEDVLVDVGGMCLPTKNLDIQCHAEAIPKRFKVTHVMVIKKYVDSRCAEGDVAVLRLEEQFEDRHVVLGQFDTAPNVLSVFGFGNDPSNPDHSQYLQFHEFETSKCKHENVGDDSFCTIESSKGNVCDGDSGGPLMEIGENYTLYGTVSRGSNCQIMKNRKRRALMKLRGNINIKIDSYAHILCGIPDIFGEDVPYGCENWIHKLDASTNQLIIY